MKLPLLRNQHGLSLVEVLIGLGVLGIILAVSIRFFGSQIKLQKVNQSRISIYNQGKFLEQIFASQGILQISSLQTGNSGLKNCLDPTSGTCQETNNWIPVAIYDPETLTQLSGKPASPAYFSGQGHPCQGGADNCQFSVTSEFKPRCFPGQTTCNAAQLVILKYTMTPHIDGRKMRSISVEREIDTGFSGIWARLNQKCPQGYGIRGISYAFEIRCENPQGDEGNPQIQLPPP